MYAHSEANIGFLTETDVFIFDKLCYSSIHSHFHTDFYKAFLYLLISQCLILSTPRFCTGIRDPRDYTKQETVLELYASKLSSWHL